MKFVTFAREGRVQPGLWLEDGWILALQDAAEIALRRNLLPPATGFDLSSMQGLIASSGAALPVVKALATRAAEDPICLARVRASDATLMAPIPRPAKNVFCVGRNYLDHVAEGHKARGSELKIPDHPQFFTKPPTSVIGPHAPIPLDARVTRKLDYEVELAVVIGRTGCNIEPSRALDHVFGYTIVNDVTARDLQRRHDQWFKGKGLDGCCPMGPWIVHAALVPDPHRLDISLLVNGEVRQNANTAQMIFDIPRIIGELSQGLTLEAGDVIATGTPSGVGYAMEPPRFLDPGDAIECRIEGIGSLVNRVAAVAPEASS